MFRAAKFAVASALGFLIAEGVLVLEVMQVYHTTSVPAITYTSPLLLGLDALALGVGVTAAFMVNERVTVKGERRGSGPRSWLVRWGKYQLASLLGNVLIVIVQLALLAMLSLSPVYGSVVGAVATYPVTYVASMRFVWMVNPLRG